MRRAITIVGILWLGLILLVPHTIDAQTGGWSQPFELSPPAPPTTVPPQQNAPQPTPTRVSSTRPTATPAVRYGSSWFPDIAIAPQGSAHVVWYSGIAASAAEGGSIDLLMYRELRDGQWSPFNSVIVPATGGYTVRNSIKVGRDGKLHVLFRAKTQLEYSNAPIGQAWNAQAWSKPRLIGNDAYYTTLAVDSRGGLHAFWSGIVIDDPANPRTECPNCSDLFYRRSADGGATWSSTMNLSQSEDGENRPQVQVDAQDRIHVVWDQGSDWYVGRGVPKNGIYRRSDDGGKTWNDEVVLGLRDEPVKQTTLGVNSRGNPLVVYRSAVTDRLYYQFSRDGGETWSVPAEIPGIRARNLSDNDLDKYSLAVDGSDSFHLVLSGQTLSMQTSAAYRLALLHLTWNGSTWSTPDAILANDLYPEWPTVVVSNGNRLHVVWFTRSQDDLFQSERARYRVWYSTRQVNAAVRTPLPLFTALPAATATAIPTEIPPPPSPTPLPPEIAAAPTITGPPTWEASGIRTVAAAILPAIVLLLTMFGIRHFMRRR